MDASSLLKLQIRAHEAAIAVLRDGLKDISEPEPSNARLGLAGMLDRARERHPLLGHRQKEVLTLLHEVYPDGHDTGYMMRTMNYLQPDVYLTVNKLVDKFGLVEKDATVSPHQYRLAPWLMGELAQPAL